MPASNTYRIALSPFAGHHQGVEEVFGHLSPQEFRLDQLCLLGTPSAIAPLAAINPASASFPGLSHLVGKLESVVPSATKVPILASAGPILDVLFKKQSWLATPAAAPLNEHLEKGDVALAVNALTHDQFVHAARLLLRHGNGHLFTHIFHWPAITERP
jgi:hypothetical protein